MPQRPTPRRLSPLVCTAAAVMLAVAPPARAQSPIVPGGVPLSDKVRRAIDDPIAREDEKRRLRVFHGVWEELDEQARRSPAYLLDRFELRHNAFTDPATEPYLRAAAAMERGDLHLIEPILADDPAPRARLLLARAQVGLAQWAGAVATLNALLETKIDPATATAEDLTAIAEGIAELAALQGVGSHAYERMMDLLGHAREVDALYYPAALAEAAILAEKDNPEEAVKAALAAAVYNPRSSRAWELLGRLALSAFDFDGVNTALLKLRAINVHHPYADALEVEMLLKQKDVDAARALLTRSLARWPNHRRLLACAAATAALRYDDAGAAAAIKQFDSVSPGHPLAHHVMGSHLAFARQYAEAEIALAQAVQRQPNWTAPQIELGLLLNQYGKDADGIAILRRATRVDPFNKRALNTLKLLEDLAGYKRLETDHFIIKWSEPIDEALAIDMAPVLEDYYEAIAEVYNHRPDRKTLIEIMPNKQYFAVRITGMPVIWTIGACTGPIVAITPPRIGKKQSGTFDWQRVMRHEFSHTVTLSATDNRVPHWFTEAAAVSQEPNPRDYDTYQLLAQAYVAGELFDLDSINWGFVRPKKPTDRPLAYAQAHWMYEYITAKYGHTAILKILELSKAGTPLPLIVPSAVGLDADTFMKQFLAWAGAEVKAWGLDPEPAPREIARQLQLAGEGPTRIAKVRELLEANPDHPDLLQLIAEHELETGDDAAAQKHIEQFAKVRPVDPWADHHLANLALKQDRPADAVPHLAVLDSHDQKTGSYAKQLVDLYTKLDRWDEAQHAAMRALARHPYDGTMRERAASIALKRNDTDLARHHIYALTLIEPDRWVHYARLAAVETKRGNAEAAKTAAQQAKKLNPDAAVEKFLNP